MIVHIIVKQFGRDLLNDLAKENKNRYHCKCIFLLCQPGWLRCVHDRIEIILAHIHVGGNGNAVNRIGR